MAAAAAWDADETPCVRIRVQTDYTKSNLWTIPLGPNQSVHCFEACGHGWSQFTNYGVVCSDRPTRVPFIECTEPLNPRVEVRIAKMLKEDDTLARPEAYRSALQEVCAEDKRELRQRRDLPENPWPTLAEEITAIREGHSRKAAVVPMIGSPGISRQFSYCAACWTEIGNVPNRNRVYAFYTKTGFVVCPTCAPELGDVVLGEFSMRAGPGKVSFPPGRTLYIDNMVGWEGHLSYRDASKLCLSEEDWMVEYERIQST